MTRVVHVISSLHTGGAEAMLAQLVLAKRSRSITFTVVSMTPGGEHRERLEHAGVDVCDLGMTRGRPDPRALLALTRILRDRRPDVVQSWMYHADLLSLLAFKLARLPKSRLYWGVRCSDMDVTAYPAQLRWTIKACARAAKFVDGVVANSFAGRDHHLALGYKPPAFPVVVNGIDVARFAPSTTARNAVRADLGIDDKAVVVINVARVDPMKGHDHLLAALGTVPGAQGLLVGAGTEALSTTGCLGLGRRDDVPALLAAADIVVNSSLFGEGFSNAVAEGMAAGLVPIVTDVGDNARVVGDVGVVVPPADVEALGRGLSDLAALDARARAQLGAAARERVRDNFGLATVVENFDALHCGEAMCAGP